MSIELEPEKEFVDVPFRKSLIEEQGGYYVTISHKELDSLVGNLMHLCDLNSDAVYREALKSEVKQRSRNWLDEQYALSGYKNYAVESGAYIINIDAIRDNKR